MHWNKNALMNEVRVRYAKRNKFAEHQTSEIDPTDRDNFHKNASIGWWFSGRPRQELRLFEKRALNVKFGSYRWLRGTTRVLSETIGRLKSVVDRRLLTRTLRRRPSHR